MPHLNLQKIQIYHYSLVYTAFKKNELDHAFEEKDLSVTMDSVLTFEEHISLKVKKANAIMGMI